MNRIMIHKTINTPHNFLSPNHFSTFDFKNYVMIMENNSYGKENTDKQQNSINMTN